MLIIVAKDGRLRFEVHAKPRARVSRIVGILEGKLELTLAAPPVDGAANEELVAFLAKRLGRPGRAVRVVRGESSRHKLIEVEGLTEDVLRASLVST